MFERFDRDYDRLVAYNAEAWKSGFGLLFVHARCIRLGVDWVFDDALFAGIWEPIKKRLNAITTTYGASDDPNSQT